MRGAAHDDVGLLHRALDHVQAGGAGDGGPVGGAALHRGGVGLKAPAGGVQGVHHQAADDVVVQSPGGGDDELVRAVVAAVVVPDGVAGDGADGVRGAADRAAQRVGAQHGGHEVFVGDVGGVVAVHGDFLEDDVAFLLHLLRVKHGAGDHVGDDVDRHGQVGVQHAGEVAGAFLRRGGVGFAAHLVKGRGDLQGGAALGALEQQVLQEVGGAVLPGRLVAGANADPEPDGGRALARHGLGQHPDAAGQDRTAHLGTAVGSVDQGVSVLVLLKRQGDDSHQGLSVNHDAKSACNPTCL